MHDLYPGSHGNPLEELGFIITFLSYMADFNSNLKDGFEHGVVIEDRQIVMKIV